MLYVFDTNSLRILSNYYPKRFPTFWQQFEASIIKQEVASAKEVFHELEVQLPDTWFLEWCKAHRALFRTPTPAETTTVAKIFAVPHFQALVGEKQRLRGSHVADPFIIACASVNTGCVVTEEAHRANGAKIPNVCDHFGIKWTNVEGFLEAKGWEF
jgi:Domain of unknown function (DUF4411)